MPRATRVAWAVLTVSVAALAVAFAMVLGASELSGSQPGESIGTRPPMTAVPVTPPQRPNATAATTATITTPTITTPTAAPVGVHIPAIDVDTTVIPVGLDRNRAVEVPDDISIVGWYEPTGVMPGSSAGSAVLVAHRDGTSEGAGVFYDLGQLEQGDRVNVTDAQGRTLRYRVVAREYLDKRSLPMEELFSPFGPPRLTLISCGGEYLPDKGGYQSNVVVTAVPA